MGPERVFADWTEPLLPAAARFLAEHYGGPRWDLSGVVVALPGARAGRRLLEILVNEAERSDRLLLPPRIVTQGVLTELLYEPSTPLAPDALSRQVWARALAIADRERLSAVFPELPADDDPVGWASLARIVFRLASEVGAGGLDFGEVADACRGPLLHRDAERWRVLAGVSAEYRRLLDGIGFSDRDAARRRALEEDRLTLDRDLWLIGMAEMPTLLRTMLRALESPVRAVVHAPESRAEAFDDLGCVAPGAWEDEVLPVPDERLSVVEGPAEQAGEVVRLLADVALDAEAAPTAEEVTVGVPDPGLVPFLEQRLDAHGIPHRYAGGTPVARTAPHRLLTAVADWLDGRRFADLAALLRHPDVQRWLGAADAPALLDDYFREHLPARIDGSVPGSSGRARRIRDLVGRLHAPERLGDLRGHAPLSSWMPRALQVLSSVYGGRSLERWKPGDRDVVEGAEALRDAAAELHRIPAAVDPECGAAAAFRILLAEAAGKRIAPEPDREAVEMVGWLELHLDDAPVLVVAGVNEPHLPESAGGDPFLPDALRSHLGLEDDGRRYARDAYRLTAILHSRPGVRLVSGRRDAAGDPLRPSRLLLTDRDGALARRIRRFTDEGAERPPALPLPLPSAPSSRFELPPERRIPLDPFPEAFRVTDFRALLSDPFRWALERRLRLEAAHDRDREMDPLGFGSLAHEVLERFGRSEECRSDDPERVARCLERILEETRRRRFGRSALASVPIQIEQLRSRLRAFATWHAARVREGWETVGTEVTVEDGILFEVDAEPIRLRGRIDRVDLHRERRTVAVFDYKTGDSTGDPDRAHRTRSGEWRDLQLPLYRHFLPHLRDPDGERLVPQGWTVLLGYVRLPKEEEKVGGVLAEGWDDAVLAEADEVARTVIRELREKGAAEWDASAASGGRFDPFASLLGGALVTVGEGGEGDGDEEEDR